MPFVMSVNVELGKGAEMLLCHLADKLSLDWGRLYSALLGWLRMCLTFAVINDTNLCLQESYVAWKNGIGIGDESPRYFPSS